MVDCLQRKNEQQIDFALLAAQDIHGIGINVQDHTSFGISNFCIWVGCLRVFLTGDACDHETMSVKAGNIDESMAPP